MGAPSWLRGPAAWVKRAIDDAKDAVADVAKTSMKGINNALSKMWDGVLKLASAAWSWIKRACQDMANSLKGRALKIKKAMDDFFSFLGDFHKYLDSATEKLESLAVSIRKWYQIC